MVVKHNEAYLALHIRFPLLLNLVPVFEIPLCLCSSLHIMRVYLRLCHCNILDELSDSEIVPQIRNSAPALVDLPINFGNGLSHSFDLESEVLNFALVMFNFLRAFG